MKERPILFSAPMVRALLDGSKTQTRRVMKAPWDVCNSEPIYRCGPDGHGFRADKLPPYGQPGDHLWVRETWMPDAPRDGTWPDVQFFGCKGSPLSLIPPRYQKPEHCIHRADWTGHEMLGWKPSIHMPRWASRILLEIVSVRVERLNDISEADAEGEGIRRWHSGNEPISFGINSPGCGFGAPGSWHFRKSAARAYQALWESINGPGSWSANPWVWCVEFSRAQP